MLSPAPLQENPKKKKEKIFFKSVSQQFSGLWCPPTSQKHASKLSPGVNDVLQRTGISLGCIPSSGRVFLR